MDDSIFLKVEIICKPEFVDILIAELSVLGYESMLETHSCLEAYIEKPIFSEKLLTELAKKYEAAALQWNVEEVPHKNWNEEWERNYEPIRVENKILVRASFHEADPTVTYDLIITPKMSFGTGHHATTYLMLKHQLEVEQRGKRVLDAGCGTAILSVMAEKLGADDIIACDVDVWSVENSKENSTLNQCTKIQVLKGTINTAGIDGKFDLILANINKNVLLEEMDAYADHLKTGGMIILSGFYVNDEADIEAKAVAHGFQYFKRSERNDWSSLIFEKN